MNIEEAKTITQMLSRLRDKKILNVCSSNEHFYKTLKPHIWELVLKPLKERGNRVINLDIKNSPGVDIVADCRDMKEVDDKSMDIVLFFSGMEHLLNPVKVLREIRRVLKDDGHMYASVPGVFPYHADPIDNGIRLPDRAGWERMLGPQWDILQFEKTKEMPAHVNYNFHQPVFATVIKAKQSHNLKKLKVDAFLLSYKREDNLEAVVAGLKRQSLINNIYLFHNHPSNRKIDGVINIVSDKNFRCIVRHAIAQMAETDYVLFIDDDLELLTDLSPRIRTAVRMEPHAIIGIFGSNVEKNVETSKLYLSGGKFGYKQETFYRYVDIVIGRFHIIRKEYLSSHIDYLNKNKYSIENFVITRDDLLLNLATQLKTKIPGLLIPIEPGKDFRSLPEPHAVCGMKTHYVVRSFLIKEFLKIGWKPYANSGRFLESNLRSGGDRIYSERFIALLTVSVAQKDWKAALKYYKKIKDKTQIPIKLIYNLAGYHRDCRRFKSARTMYRWITESKHNSAVDLIALAYYHLGNLSSNRENAIRYLKKCLKWMPGHRKAAENLAQLLQKHEYKKVIK
ncbi:MAG: methyltransferase domain-containing protein [bacterium]|nr:methyltransferase domain-containing protein [bacterium]